ncbi:FliH/SctL family protein [Fibrobacterales bacterium]|nr:FliH/SctL family protein [Fibrobacterales bacterium]
MDANEFQPMKTSKVGLKGIVRADEMTKVDDFETGGFPSMESLAVVQAREKMQSKMRELEIKVNKLEQEKTQQKRRFEEEISLLKKEVFANGEKQGIASGHKKADEEHLAREAALKARIGEILDEFEGQKNDFFKAADDTLLPLLDVIVRTITGAWATDKQELMERVVKNCLGCLGNEQSMTLFLNAEDLVLVQQGVQKWLPMSSGRVSIKLQVDSRLEAGSCFMETEAGSVESSYELMLERVMEVIKKGLGG